MPDFIAAAMNVCRHLKMRKSGAYSGTTRPARNSRANGQTQLQVVG